MKRIKPSLLIASLLLGTVPAFLNTGNSMETNADAFLLSYEEMLRTVPGTIGGDFKFTTVTKFGFEEGSLGYVFQDDLNASRSLTFDYGYKNDGLFMVPARADGYDTRLLAQTHLPKSIETADGVLAYVDARNSPSVDGKTYGFGVGMILMDSKEEPPSGPSLYTPSKTDGHFKYYYPVDGKAAYYYDYGKGRFVPTTIVNKTATLNDGYAGWVYVPFASYGWNAKSGSSYLLAKHGFERNFKYLNYSHVLTRGLDYQCTDHEFFFDEFMFVQKGEKVTFDFKGEYLLKDSCFDVGGLLEKDQTTANYRFTKKASPKGHVYKEFLKIDEKEAVSYCENCGHFESFKDQETIAKASLVDDLGYVTYTFHIGFNRETPIEIKVKKGTTISKKDIPFTGFVKDNNGYRATFLSWGSSSFIHTPLNPLSVVANQDRDFYAFYVTEEYDNPKYADMIPQVAKHGGLYKQNTGRLILYGASNFAMAGNIESDYAKRGIPTINNSIGGSTIYNYLDYCDTLIMPYKPKMVFTSLLSNNTAYWSMSDREIKSNFIKLCDYIHARLPECVIVISSGSPLPGRPEGFEAADRMSEWGRNFCEQVDYLEYIDTYEFDYERMTEYPEGWSYWTHFDTQTQYVRTDLLGDALEEIIDRRGITF